MPETIIRGTIIRGDGRGRALGFPTANLDVQVVDRAPGIYAGKARLLPDTIVYSAVIHYGPRPTFPGASPTFEVHLLQFPDRDLYDQTLEVSSLIFLRSIETFASIPDLQQALVRDCEQALDVLTLKK